MTRIHSSALAVGLAAGLGAVAGAAHAQQSDLERFEAAAEAMSEQMFSLIAQEQPAVRDALPQTDWNSAFREAGACVLDRIREETSDANIDRMLGELEMLAAAEFDSLAQMRAANDATGPGLPQDRMLQINESCGMEAAMRQRMADSDFLDAMRTAQQTGTQ